MNGPTQPMGNPSEEVWVEPFFAPRLIGLDLLQIRHPPIQDLVQSAIRLPFGQSTVHGGKKIAIMLDQQYQELEVWYPYYRLKEEGAQVVRVAPKSAGAT